MRTSEKDFARMLVPMVEKLIGGVDQASEAWFAITSHMEMHNFEMKDGQPQECWLQILNSLSLVTTLLFAFTGSLRDMGGDDTRKVADRALEANERFIERLMALQRYRRQR